MIKCERCSRKDDCIGSLSQAEEMKEYCISNDYDLFDEYEDEEQE